MGVTEAYENTSFINEVMAVINDLAFDYLDVPMVRVAAVNGAGAVRRNPRRSGDPQCGTHRRRVPKGGQIMAVEVYIPKFGQTVEEVKL